MTGSFTAKEFKIIQWVLDSRDATPLMGVYPYLRYQVRGTGEIVECNIKNLVGEYKEWQKAQAAEKARLKKMADKQSSPITGS